MFATLLPLLLALLPAAGSDAPARPGDEPAVPAEVAAPEGTPAPPAEPVVDPLSPLEPAERDTLLRLAWRTLSGHLTGHPIRDEDLQAFDLTPRLLHARGCFVTLRKAGVLRGRQGEIEASRPLYQQVIVFTRRAATRDARFLPLTDIDLADTVIEVSVIGPRERVEGPAGIQLDRHGIFLEKWGRRALFLPGEPAAQHFTAERTLEELCRQASLPAGGWREGSRIEVFTSEVISGALPPPSPEPVPAPSPAP